MTTIFAHSTDTLSLCDTMENSMVKSDGEIDEWLLEDNRKMAHKGMLDEFKDYHVFEADLEQA